MFKTKIITIIAALLVIIATMPAKAVNVQFYYTADNIVSAWYQIDGGTTTLSAGPNAGNWQIADSYTLDLEVCHTYQFIWQVKNLGTPAAGNPGGFLAEIKSPVPIQGSSLLSSASWEVYVQYGSHALPDFNAVSWSNATQYAQNKGPSIWYSVKGSPIAGISGDAWWIWGPKNFADAGAPGPNDSVFLKAIVHPIPEPGTLLLLGSGLLGVGIAACIRRKKS